HFGGTPTRHRAGRTDLDGVERNVRDQRGERRVTCHPVPDRVERMDGHGQTLLVVDQADRLRSGQSWWNAFLNIEGDHVAVQRADFLADNDLHTQLGVVTRIVPGAKRTTDPV